MAFWGVEVKPGRPFVHTYISESGPLRLSQATLGIGVATERSVLQCNVGDKAPVLLCSLLPNRIESTCLDLEFEEKGAVVFSVIGPRSVHLAGYFLTGSSRRGGGDANESESFGEDIWDTGSNQSGSHRSSEDKYDSDFIDDGDIEISPSPRCDSGAGVKDVIEEKPVNENRARRRLRKKHQISDSDEEAVGPQDQIDGDKKSPVSESEEEDGFPISFSLRNRDKEKKIDEDVKLDSKVLDVDKKRKVDVVVKDEDLESGEDEVVAVSSGKSKKNKDRIKSQKPLEMDTAIPVEDIRDKQSKDQNKYAYDKGDESELCEGQNEKVNQDHAHEVVLTENKPKKKKKGKFRRGETEARGDLMVDKYEEGACMEKIDAIGNIEQANIGDDVKHTVIKSGGQGIHDEKDALGSHEKLKRKKKKTKGKSYVEEENTPGEALQKDDNDKNQMMEVVKNKASRSRKKRDKERTVCEQHPETTANVNEETSSDVHHETNKKKRKKNR